MLAGGCAPFTATASEPFVVNTASANTLTRTSDLIALRPWAGAGTIRANNSRTDNPSQHTQ